MACCWHVVDVWITYVCGTDVIHLKCEMSRATLLSWSQWKAWYGNWEFYPVPERPVLGYTCYSSLLLHRKAKLTLSHVNSDFFLSLVSFLISWNFSSKMLTLLVELCNLTWENSIYQYLLEDLFKLFISAEWKFSKARREITSNLAVLMCISTWLPNLTADNKNCDVIFP